MDDKLKIALETLFDALTVSWEDNGNIMADAVRDSVITRLSEISGMSFKEIESKVEKMVEDAQ
jgi:hypothetical protein